MVCGSKEFSAIVALKRLFTGVLSVMDVQIVFVRKTSMAFIGLVRLLAGVDASMYCQID